LKNSRRESLSEKIKFSLSSDNFEGFPKEAAHLIIAAMVDGVTVVGLDGKILDCNEAVLRLHGLSRDEYIGKSVYDFIEPEDRQRAIEEASEVVEKGHLRSEVRALRKGGGTFDAEINVSLLKDASGEPRAFLGVTRDITEWNKNKESLKKAEEKFRSIFENANDCMIYLDATGRILDVNKRAVEVLGGSKKELLGKHFAKLGIFSPRDIPMVLSSFAKILASKKDALIIRIKNKEGREIPLECVGSLTKIDDKLAILIIARDITEREKTEEALKESEERLRQLIECAPDAIYINDLQGNFIDGNKQAENLTGYRREELIGKNFLKIGILPKRYLPKAAKALMKNFLGQRTGPDEFELIRKDGRRVTVEISTFPVKRGGRVEVIGIARDITERKQMEEKLRQYSEHLEELVKKRTEELLESEKKYSVLVEEASDGVAIIQDEKIVFVNKKGAETLSFSRDELIEVPFEKLVDERYRTLARKRYEMRLRGEKVPATLEIELIAKNGERIPVELSDTLITYQNRPANLVIVRDIGERKRTEEQRLKLEKLATIGELSTMVAHDLRNPLTSIRNACFYIKNICPCHGNAECKTALEMLDIIEKETLFANNIINDLLDFAAKRPLQKKRQNINKLIEHSLIESNIPENIKVKKEFTKKAIATIDEKQLERVFLNLIKNAVQAMPNGGKLTVTTNEAEDYVEIVFTDTGVGIPDENMSKIFTPLFTTKAKGIGMGLPICKRIVEEHGGTIEVKSKVGQYTTFIIKLPKNEKQVINDEPNEAIYSIADDDEGVCKNPIFNLTLLDIRLPDMEGTQI
jgi:two-component system sporulation sensor kinase A